MPNLTRQEGRRKHIRKNRQERPYEPKNWWTVEAAVGPITDGREKNLLEPNNPVAAADDRQQGETTRPDTGTKRRARKNKNRWASKRVLPFTMTKENKPRTLRHRPGGLQLNTSTMVRERKIPRPSNSREGKRPNTYVGLHEQGANQERDLAPRSAWRV